MDTRGVGCSEVKRRLIGWLRQRSPVVRRGSYQRLARWYDDQLRRSEELARRHTEVSKRFLEANHSRATFETWVPPGHFYSPYPDLDEIEARTEDIFNNDASIAGVELNGGAQLELLETMAELAADLPFPAEPEGQFRYWLNNPAYAWADGIVLCALLRHIAPRRVVEVGSGYSSALILDTAERWLDPCYGSVQLQFVEPYAELLHGFLRADDDQRIVLHEQPVQDVPLDVFAELAAGDVLFIDSTHVVKAGSDVVYLFFEVLPRLAKGVWVHVHDIFWPFEYPLSWVREGRAWHETYLLRAFLMDNASFEIRWFQDYMWKRHKLTVESRIPAMAKNAGGNLWLQKVR